MTRSEVYDLLTRAQDLIRDPARWTQGCFARSAASGEPTRITQVGVVPGSPEDSDTCRCAVGALRAAAQKIGALSLTYREAEELLDVAAKKIGGISTFDPVNVNDDLQPGSQFGTVFVPNSRAHKLVMSMYDLARKNVRT